jgi:autotransporter-associated beta strand protein
MKRKNPKLMSSWFRGNKAVIKLQMAFAVCLVSQAKAASVYWDANGDITGAGAAPAGIWGTDEFWNTTAEGDVTIPGAWVDGDTAVFASGTDAVDAYTVNTTGTINVSGLVFEEGTPTIAGSGSLNFGAGPVVLSGAGNGVIAANVSGTGFNKNQGGTVVLSGSTTVTGNLNVNAGTLTIAGPMTVSGNLRFGWNNTGGTQNLIIQTGADITTDRFIMADWYYVNDTVSHTGGTLNVNGSNDSNGTGASFLLGHWGYGSTTVYNLSGGTLNAPNARLSLGWDRSNVQLNQSGGTANLRGINLDNGRGNAASYNLTGGRLNIGAGGINNQANKSINAGDATIGATDNWTSAKAINLTSTVTFDSLDAVDGTTARTMTLTNGATGAGGIIKNGAGTLSLGTTAGGSDYSGDTVVNAGRFLAGSVLSSKIVANSGSVIGTGSSFTPGKSQVNDIEANTTIFNFRVGGANSDSLDVLDLNVISASQVSLSPAGPLFINDQFTVIKYTTLTGLGFAGLSAATLPNPHYSADLIHDSTAQEIKLVITGAESVLWTGASSSAWDINTTANWKLESDSSTSKFYNDDVITFDDTATTGTVTLAADVAPASVLFINDSLDYTVSGSGKISGPLGITKSGTGTLTFESSQAYQGVTEIMNGTLVVKGSLSNTSITNSGVLVYDLAANQSVAYAITGGGSLVKRGEGVLTIPNNKNFSGGVTVENGTLHVTAGGWYVNPFGASNIVTVEESGKLSTSGAHNLGVDANSIRVKGTLTLGAEQYVSNLQLTGGLVNGSGPLRTFGGTMSSLASAESSEIATPLQLVGSATLYVEDGDAADDLIVSGAIINNNNLTKTGDGTLKLTATNTFAGDTAVNAGVLKVSGASLSDTNKLVINGGVVDPSGSNETVNTLFFGATQQQAGTWGATGSGADNINDTYFTGTGVVTVITGPPSAYNVWATATGATGGKAGDTDGDGVSNLMEFATNSNPSSGASRSKVYSKIHTLSGEDVLTFTVAVRTGATFADGATDAVKQESAIDEVKYTIEASDDLTAWNVVNVDKLGNSDAANVRAAITNLPALDSGWEWHTFRTSGSTSASDKRFIRLMVSEVTP